MRKVQNFFRHCHTEILRIPAFFLPPKTIIFVSRQKPLAAAVHGTSLWYVAQITEKSCRIQTKDVFFGDQHKIGEKDASMGAMTFFFFFLEITLKPDQSDEKIFDIFTLSLERLHYLWHFRRR